LARWGGNTKPGEEKAWERVDWINLAQDTAKLAVLKKVMYLRVP
jgi:hypothetical protein